MKFYKNIRKAELVTIPLLTFIWIIYSVLKQIRYFDDMMLSMQRAKIPLASILKDLEYYEPLLNINFPFVAGGTLALAGWYLFHFLAYPKISRFQLNQSGLFYFFISVIIVFTGIYIFYSFRQELRFNYRSGNIHGITAFSYFRKLYVVKETLKWIILIGLYELIAQVIYYISEKQYRKADNSKFTAFNILIMLLLSSIFLFYILDQIDTNSRFFLAGLLLQMVFLSGYVYYVLLPYHPLFNSWEFREKIFLYIILCVVSSFIVQLFIFEKDYYLLYVFQTCALAFFLPPTVSSLINRFAEEKNILKTQLSSRSAELLNLRSQINPHFLFNALNSLYATALNENSEKTADGIQKLGDIMRFMLHENNHDQIPLSSEIAYLHNYIEIQRMRLDETQNIEIRINIQEPKKEIHIAPMLLNPFVENAFKHGISLQNPSWIYITLTLDANHLYFKVHNSLHQQTGIDPEKNNTGIGLINVEKRLKLIYPDRYKLHIQKSAQDYFASLTLTF